jgi:predicted acyltransferase (DUF342 family)
MKNKMILVLIFLAVLLSLSAANDTPVVSGNAQDTVIQAEQIEGTPPIETETQEKPAGFFKSTGGVIILVLVFLVLLTIPFLPAIMEMVNPKDNKPLFIDQEYTRDPTYVEKKFLDDLKPLLAATVNDRKANAVFKNRIPVVYHDDFKASDSTKVDNLLIIENNFSCGKNVSLNQPLYIKGKAEFGEKCNIEIAMVNGDVLIGRDSKINSWISSNSGIKAGKTVSLGDRLTCAGVLQLSEGCTFTNLYAMPIASHNTDLSKGVTLPSAVEFPKEQREAVSKVNDANWYVSKKLVTIPPYSLVNNSMIIKTDLVLRKGSVVNGDLKVYGKVVLEDDVRIFGELLCIGDVEIGKDCYIRENLFTQSFIVIKSGARFGLPGQHKSVIGKKGISLASNVVIYGNALTAGKGIVV